MRLTTTTAAAGLLGLALLTPLTGASAAGETCRGEAATIVGTGPSITGTEGRDVIVTGTAGSVSALGGDDLVCVTGSGYVAVDAGTGDDLVDATGAVGDVVLVTELGEGADTYVGGAAADRVSAGPAVGGDGVDRISTGAGDDAVSNIGGDDVVDLGEGRDRAEDVEVVSRPGGSLTGGAGDDVLAFDRGAVTASLDLAQGTFRTVAPGVDATLSFSSFEGIDAVVSGTDLTYSGTDAPDRVDVDVRPPATARLDVRTLGGHDELLVDGVKLLAPGSAVDLGGDSDLFAARGGSKGLVGLDLGTDRLRVDDRTFPVRGVEDAFVSAARVVMTGDAAGNDLQTSACRATLRGRAGRDRLTHAAHDPWFEDDTLRCPKPRTSVVDAGPGRDRVFAGGGDARVTGGSGDDRIRTGGGDDHVRGGAGDDRIETSGGRDHVRGDAGDDVLVGGGGDDVLVGGPGRDRVDGSKGRDRCDAERERRCER